MPNMSLGTTRHSQPAWLTYEHHHPSDWLGTLLCSSSHDEPVVVHGTVLTAKSQSQLAAQMHMHA